MNNVILLGRVGNVEPAYLPSGQMVLKLSIADDQSYKDKKSNQKVEKTVWHNVQIFGPRAEKLSKFMTKGMQVYLECNLSYSQVETEQGKKYFTNLSVKKIEILSSKKDASSSSNNQQQHEHEKDFTADDIPF